MRVAAGPVSGGHTALIERASFSPDGRAFVTPELPLNRDFAVRVWTEE